MNCDRCKLPMTSFTMSRFNTEDICLECETKETAHPRYKEAVEAELKQVRAGNYNYPGIGKPEDL